MEETGEGGGDLSNCTRLVAQGLFLVAKLGSGMNRQGLAAWDV